MMEENPPAGTDRIEEPVDTKFVQKMASGSVYQEEELPVYGKKRYDLYFICHFKPSLIDLSFLLANLSEKAL